MADGDDSLLFELEDFEISEWFLNLDSIDLSWLFSYILGDNEAPLPPDLADIRIESLLPYEEGWLELLDDIHVNQPSLLTSGNDIAGEMPIAGHRRIAIWRPYRWGNSFFDGTIELSPITVMRGIVLWEVERILLL